MSIKTRFAPSPTGYLHIGSVRTALFSWLQARHYGGTFVLRIEDTDQERSTRESADAILAGMSWLGLNWDEGPHYQTERFDRYAGLAEQLVAEGNAYRCYCTKEELDEMREQQVARGDNPRYDGRCRERSEPREGVNPVVRLRTPDTGTVEIDDLVRGRVTYENELLDDLVILRPDGTPTFHFGVVADDADMGITHVIRGDDHLNNTARHIHLQNALGFDHPVYAHLPMILGEDGSRLSKRHGALNVLEYREQGYLPEAVLNYLVRLGWSHGDQEVFSVDEMIELFDVEDANASASKFNPEKLRWLNQQYIMTAAPLDLTPGLVEQMGKVGIDPSRGPAPQRVVEAYRERAETLRELAMSAEYLYTDNIPLDEKAAKKNLRPVVKEALTSLRDAFTELEPWTAEGIHRAMQDVADKHELKFGKIGQPVRVAVTGTGVSPPIDATVELVGRERTLARLDAALVYIEERAAAAG
ncbi:MAG: glutamate--tRNA ligase [Gammaproteobacteria bacterium]|jgi:glutamyl-tRNA synthetase|nr:glutamate--tRNA ligase [Gammaproteobacteria bacterium]MDP6615776.1 glutamate--tRNA ligase [Gammaproteobacteria bacterium]MDP6695538.1 glutamate--tRNA ligase [Gammaproteobacteria bacterium]